MLLTGVILGIGCVGTYLLAMCLPAIAAKSYYKTYLLHWIVSPTLLLIGTWIECLRQRKTF